MPDINDAGTADAGTQDVDAAISTGTADTGTPIQPTQPTGENPIADSQPISDTNQATPPPQASAGKQVPNPAKAGADTANPWESDDNPYRKRFNDTLSHSQRLYQENQQRDRQLNEFQTRIADFESKAKAAAETAKLNPWNKGHPEHAKFQAVSSKAESYQKLLSKAETPEKKAMLREMMSGEFSADDLASLERAESDRKQMLSDLSADPRGFIASHVQDAVKSAIAEYDSYQGARQQVQGMITNPNNAKLIEAYAPDMHRMMDPNISASEKAFAFASMKAELDALKTRISQNVEQVATAEARQSARSGRTTTSKPQQGESRHPRDAQRIVQERLSKRGINPGDTRYDSALADELLRPSSA